MLSLEKRLVNESFGTGRCVRAEQSFVKCEPSGTTTATATTTETETTNAQLYDEFIAHKIYYFSSICVSLSKRV